VVSKVSSIGQHKTVKKWDLPSVRTGTTSTTNNSATVKSPIVLSLTGQSMSRLATSCSTDFRMGGHAAISTSTEVCGKSRVYTQQNSTSSVRPYMSGRSTTEANSRNNSGSSHITIRTPTPYSRGRADNYYSDRDTDIQRKNVYSTPEKRGPQHFLRNTPKNPTTTNVHTFYDKKDTERKTTVSTTVFEKPRYFSTAQKQHTEPHPYRRFSPSHTPPALIDIRDVNRVDYQGADRRSTFTQPSHYGTALHPAICRSTKQDYRTEKHTRAFANFGQRPNSK